MLLGRSSARVAPGYVAVQGISNQNELKTRLQRFCVMKCP